MSKKIMTIFALCFVFIISSVCAEPNENSNNGQPSNEKNNGKRPNTNENGSIASASTSIPEHPEADFHAHDGLFKAELNLGCVNVKNAGEEYNGTWNVRMEKLGNSHVWNVIFAEPIEGVKDCKELFGNFSEEELE